MKPPEEQKRRSLLPLHDLGGQNLSAPINTNGHPLNGKKAGREMDGSKYKNERGAPTIDKREHELFTTFNNKRADDGPRTRKRDLRRFSVLTFTAEHVSPALVVPTPVVSTDLGLSFAANRKNWLFPQPGSPASRNASDVGGFGGGFSNPKNHPRSRSLTMKKYGRYRKLFLAGDDKQRKTVTARRRGTGVMMPPTTMHG